MVNVSHHPAGIVTCVSHKQRTYTGITQIYVASFPGVPGNEAKIYGDLHRQRTNTGPLEER